MEKIENLALVATPLFCTPQYILRDAIHTQFVTLICKWTIVGGWVKHLAHKRGKVGKLRYKSFPMSMERADKKTGWVKSLSSVTKCVWMASLISETTIFTISFSKMSKVLRAFLELLQ